MLRNVPELPLDLSMIQKQIWDVEAFHELVQQVLTRPDWGPGEPKIEMPAESSIAASGDGSNDRQPPLHTPYAGLPGPLTATGLTGPLSSGLRPPPVGPRVGHSRG